MKTPLMFAIPCGIFATFVMWWLGEHLSSDAIGMAIGLTVGVFSLLPTFWLVSLAHGRDAQDDWQPTIIDYPARGPRPLPYSSTPLMLPDRQTQIAELRTVLDYIEAQELTQ